MFSVQEETPDEIAAIREVNRAAFANFRFTVFMRGASAGFILS